MAVLDAGVREKTLLAIQTLSRLGTVRAAYVFGSQVEGADDEWSDIDVAVFMDYVENWNIQRRTQAMVLVMDEAGNDMEVHFYPSSALENPGCGSFAEYILRHGVSILD